MDEGGAAGYFPGAHVDIVSIPLLIGLLKRQNMK